MIPIGYMAKQIEVRPGWLAGGVAEIASVSRCISGDFADWVDCWKHNGYWLFDSPEVIRDVARELGVSLEGTTLFYYEVHDLEFDVDDRCWTPFAPEPSFSTCVVPPTSKELEGFDVVSYLHGNAAGCSPLSCNSLAESVATNPKCLMTEFEAARQHLEDGVFDDSEPGPIRIVAVYSTGWP